MATVVNKTTKEQLRKKNAFNYSTDEWLINPDFSNVEHLPNRYWKVVDDQLVPMTQEEMDVVDGNRIEDVRSKKIGEVNTIIQARIEQGFEYDSTMFPLDTSAQLNYTLLYSMVVNKDLTEDDFPYKITTIDDQVYMLSWANFSGFVSTYLTSLFSILAYEREMKAEIRTNNTPSQIMQVEETVEEPVISVLPERIEEAAKPLRNFYTVIAIGSNSNKTSWRTMGSSFRYIGASNGTLTSVKIVCWVDKDDADGSIRIYDVDNNDTIAQVDDINSRNMSIIDITSFSNLSGNPAVWEIQAKVDKGGRNLYVESIELNY